jgi:predicted ATPase/transcriptional regulator with XRE-family HTH domain
MSDHDQSFGRQLRRFRLRAGLTREGLAERAGLSVATLAALEGGQRRSPYPNTVVTLAEALGLSGDERGGLLELANRGSVVRRRTPVPEVTPIQSQPSPRVSLPLPPTALIGRDAEVAAAAQLLDPGRSAVRLLTLTGPGGVGKTRLAVAVAGTLTHAYVAGIVFVDLAPVRDQRLVAATIAKALELRVSAERGADELLMEGLREQQMLLLLDNVEHLAGASGLLGALLEACAGLRLLVTSRAALRLRSEQQFRVAPLPTPAEDERRPEVLANAAAVRLFVDRAQAAAPPFQLDADNAYDVASICRRLDGMPLAIELPAARVQLLRPAALLARLERRLPLLTGGAPELPERQQTLRRTLTWSHDLLRPPEQMLLRRLAGFTGGWTLEAAEAICARGDLATDYVVEGLAVLVNNSLIYRTVGPDREPRFGMREIVREYALEQLVASGELEHIRAAHAGFYSRLAEPMAVARTIAPWIGSQAPPVTDAAIETLELEFDNIQSALDWWLTTQRPAEGLRLAIAFHSLWSRHGQYGLGRRWLEAMLDLAERVVPDTSFRLERAVALTEAGTLAGYQADNHQARAFHQRSVAAWRQLDHPAGLAIALANLGLAEWINGQPEQAVVLLKEALVRSRTANVPHTVAISWRNLGLIARALGDYVRAQACFTEAADCGLPTGWFRGYSVARSMSCLGRVAYLQDDLPRARALFRRAFELTRQADVTGQALADCLDWQAALEAASGDLDRAVRLFGAAEAHWRTSAAHRYLPDEPAYARDLASVRALVDDQTFADGWAEGAAMSPSQAVACALHEPVPSASP